MDIIKNKNIFFIISGILIVPGMISLFLFGLKPSIEFTGGSKIEYSVKEAKNIKKDVFEKAFKDKKVKLEAIKVSGNEVSIRTEQIDQKKKEEVGAVLKKEIPALTERSFETVGATIGSETEINALKAVAIASIAITLYIAFAFRKVSKPVASWKYGLGAVLALLHDVLLVVGVYSLLGHFFGVEVDSLFITALLTVMGFSVHDTIVVFDRIRENLRKNYDTPFEAVVNNSVLETFNRSVNTSLTVVIVLVTLLLFGGEAIRWFVLALLIGILSGTYSSIFNAAPLLVVWYEWDKKRKNKK